MNTLRRIFLIPLLFLFAMYCALAQAADGDSEWTPTPPRLSFSDGEVSYWRQGADDWVRAQPNLPLAEGDALYTGSNANFEVQFGDRSFARADEHSQLSLLQQQERLIQFKVTGGRVSFDMRTLEPGITLEVSTPNAVFVIEHAGYYRVEVGDPDTHFITRRGGEATVITADGRSLSIYPSEDIVVTAGDPVKVATYAAPAPDDWDRWNDARSDRIDDSVSARYLPPGVYGGEELDHYGNWRVVPTYGSVWIPYGVSAGWAPYSTGYWVWDPYYEWTWVDYAPWGWAPFHYGRWVYINGYWGWVPGPVVRRPGYSPALVAFMVRDGLVSGSLSVGLPGLWWVALSWGEPVLPWWGPPARRWKPYWGGWAGPRIVNNVVIQQTTVVNVRDIRYQNASQPRAILTVPADKFGRERVQATVENRYRHTEFAPARGELPVKPTPASLSGGAPKGIQPPREIVTRPVVTTRIPRQQTPVLQDAAPRVRTQAVPQSRYVIPPTRRTEDARAVSRPPFGADVGPERKPEPRPPRYEELRKSTPPPVTTRGQATTREQATERRAVQPAIRPVQPSPASPPPTTRSQTTTREQPAVRQEARPATRPVQPSTPAPTASRPAAPAVQAPARAPATAPRGEVRKEEGARPLPGHPASQTYRGRERDVRETR
jgi:hypothetical protein